MGEIGFSYESKKKKVAATKPKTDQKLEETKALAKKTGDEAMARYKKDTSGKGAYKIEPVVVTAERDKPATKSASTGKKKSGFGSAFAEARKAGKSIFEWNGKKYTTKLASGEKKKSASKTSPRPKVEESTPDTKPDFAKIKSSVGGESLVKAVSDGASEVTEAYGVAAKRRKQREGSMA